jgi:hypothetical protein
MPKMILFFFYSCDAVVMLSRCGGDGWRTLLVQFFISSTRYFILTTRYIIIIKVKFESNEK